MQMLPLTHPLAISVSPGVFFPMLEDSFGARGVNKGSGAVVVVAQVLYSTLDLEQI